MVIDSNQVKTLGKFLTEVWLPAKLCNSGFYQDVMLTLDVNILRLHCGGRLLLLLVYSNHIRILLLKNLWFDLESQ